MKEYYMYLTKNNSVWLDSMTDLHDEDDGSLEGKQQMRTWYDKNFSSINQKLIVS